MNLPQPPSAYDQNDQAQTRAALEQADAQNVKAGNTIEVAKGKLILTSPNGTRYNITVSNAGALVVTAL